MGKLGKLTDKLEHEAQAVIDSLAPALKPIWRAARKLGTQLLQDLADLINGELQRRRGAGEKTP